MSDSLELLRRTSAGRTSGAREEDTPEEEVQGCAAFGSLRGSRDRAFMLECQFSSNNRLALPYSWLGPVSYNPSAGLLLKFVGDKVYLVLIVGSNLDVAVSGTSLRDGILRHRVVWVRQMTEPQLREAKQSDVTVESIRVVTHRHDEEPPDAEWLRPFRIGS